MLPFTDGTKYGEEASVNDLLDLKSDPGIVPHAAPLQVAETKLIFNVRRLA